MSSASPECKTVSSGLIDYEAALDCIHCGLCLPHCPTYQETGRETSSPRGRIYLIRGVAEGRLTLDPQVVEEMYFCLACRACESACPAGVRYGHLVETMRAEIDARSARSRVKRFLTRFVLRHVIASRRLLGAMAGGIRFYQRSGLQSLVRCSGVLRLLPPLRRAERILPPLSDTYHPPIVVPSRVRRRGRVALFSGCLMPEFFGSVNRATVEVLVHNGFEVEIPRRQQCCGALHLHAGDPDAAQRLLAKNRSAFHADDVDAIIVNSAGCGAVLKEYDDRIAQKIRDISEFLHEVGFCEPQAELRLRVAYDDPCHLVHGQRITLAPRALLRAIPGVELLDLPGSTECCGSAGVYNLTHPEMSERLLARKIEALRGIGADAIATGNPGCLLQIGRGVREAGLEVDVVHPVELIARAYSAE